MIFLKTKLQIVDNSGARVVECIKTLGGSKRKKSFVGNLIIIRVITRNLEKYLKKTRRKKGKVQLALIIRSISKIYRKNGTILSFNKNAAILINDDIKPIGSRIIGPIIHELRQKKYMKILSISSFII
jgi:large subunit ribosomal protein L14